MITNSIKRAVDDIVEAAQAGCNSNCTPRTLVTGVDRLTIGSIVDYIVSPGAKILHVKQDSFDGSVFWVSGAFLPKKRLYATKARSVLCWAMANGAKIVPYSKMKKNMMSKPRAAWWDLLSTGKTSIKMPDNEEMSRAVSICKSIKGKFTCWKTTKNAVKESDIPNRLISRFRGADWIEAAQQDVTVIGAGGVSSNIIASISRVMGNRILEVWDDDTIEPENLGGQDFTVFDIGRIKVNAVCDKAQQYNPCIKVVRKCYRFGVGCNIASDVLIMGVDSMESRKEIFNLWLNSYCKLLIDGRLSAEKWQVFCLTKSNKAAIKEYKEKWLFPDSEAEGEVCSLKQTAYAAQMIGSYITNLYINWCSSLNSKAAPRCLPFFSQYDAKTMNLQQRDADE